MKSDRTKQIARLERALAKHDRHAVQAAYDVAVNLLLPPIDDGQIEDVLQAAAMLTGPQLRYLAHRVENGEFYSDEPEDLERQPVLAGGADE